MMEDKKDQIDVLDKGFVRLVSYDASDEEICNAARVSYQKGTKKVRENRDLIRYLLRHEHGTPFEMNFFKFHVKAPIFVFRQWHRHRVGISINEISGRYSELDEECYLPELNRMQIQSSTNKQGSGDIIEERQANNIIDYMEASQGDAFAEYKYYLENDVARELARINLPVSTYSQMYWACNLRSLFHFLRLRMDAHCYSADTEVLTKNGWKFFPDVKPDDEVYSTDEQENVEFLNPVDIIKENYCGEMISVKSQSIDLLVTPNHKCFVKTSSSTKSKWKLMDANNCENEKIIYMKKNCLPIKGDTRTHITLSEKNVVKKDAIGVQTYKFFPREIDIKKWLRFLGFYLSDGFCNSSNFEVNLCKGSKDTIDFYEKLLKNITPSKIYRHKVGNGTCEGLMFEDGLIHSILSPIGNVYNKHIPNEYFNYDHSLLMHLYMGLMDGDSNSRSANTGKKFDKVGLYYSSSSLQLANDFQRLLLHIGLSGSLLCLDRIGQISQGFDSNNKPYRIETKSLHYQVSINQYRNTPLIKNSVRNAFSKHQYSGPIYCLSLSKNNTLFVRRNGKTVWSGNSQYEIRQYADAIYNLIKPIVPISCEAFEDYVLNAQTFSAQELKVIDQIKRIANIDPSSWTTYGKEAGLSKREISEMKSKLNVDI